MQAYLAVKFHEHMGNRPLIERLSDLFARHGVELSCVIRDLERWGEVRLSPADLMRGAFEALERADFVLVELSEKGVGIGIEAGFAYAKGIPIFTIAASGSEISGTLRGISSQVWQYTEENLGSVCREVACCAAEATSRKRGES